MKVAILFLAAALGSASPVRMQNSMQARDAQNACDCSKPFQVFDVGETQSCPDGYKNIAVTWFPKCVQIGCSAEDHKAQCDAKPQDAKSPTAVEQPTPTDTKPQDTKSPAVVEQPTTTPTTIGEQNACDCSKPFLSFDLGEEQSCLDGYKNIAPNGRFPRCAQIGCSIKDYKAQCDAKPQDAKSPTAVEQPTPTDTKPQDTKSLAVVEQPTTTPTTIGEQNACDCSKPFLSFDLGEEQSCLDGYKNIAPNGRFPRCAQIGCSIKDYKAQCDAKPQDATPAI